MMIVKRILPAVAAAVLFFLPRADGGQPAYQVQAVVGDVKIIAGGAAKPAAEGQSLGGGDTVVTGKNSMADIVWGDRGLVRINEKTKITVASLSKKSDDPDLDMNAGSIMVMLSKLVRGESFQVKTPTQVASVRGTSFQVDADDDRSRVAVLTGAIMVHPVLDGKIFREIAESVAEEHSVTLNRSLVRDVIAGRKKIAVSLLQKGDLDRLAGRFSAVRESRGFTRLNSRIRDEINNRIERRRERTGEGGDRDRPRRDKMKQERGNRRSRAADR
jgi:hypothetical protein